MMKAQNIGKVKHSNLGLILACEGSGFPVDALFSKLTSYGLDAESLVVSRIHESDFYVRHLLDHGENPGDVKILIASRSIPALELAARLPNVVSVVTTDQRYRNIAAFPGFGSKMPTRFHYVPESLGYQVQMMRAVEEILGRSSGIS